MQNQKPNPTNNHPATHSTSPSALYPIRGTKVFSPYPVNLTPAEHRLVFSLQKIFPAEQIFPDCYFPKPSKDHHTTNFALNTANLIQIDCLAISQFGIFVFESKDFSGWIYGHGDRRQWTEVLNFGQDKHQFYSPVFQNSLHLAALSTFLPENFPLYSIIVFGRNATLKVITDLPADCHVCTQSNLRSILNQLLPSSTSIPNPSISEIKALINQSRIDPTANIRENHISEAQFAQKTPKF